MADEEHVIDLSGEDDQVASDLTLKVWLVPSMQTPFSNFEPEDHPFVVSPTSTIGDIMDKLEVLFRAQCEANGSPFEFQTSVIWNWKDDSVTLNPRDEIGQHFENGDYFGIYGIFQQVFDKLWLFEEQKTPVTILTGFLGSGKTTLLNYILQEQQEKKIAVIENEFGEIAIDDALLKQDKLALAEKVVLMENGCICCTVRGDLEKGLREILDEMHRGTQIDSIIIETTGMADPVPIVRTFMANKLLTARLRLDGIIALADAKHLEGRLDDQVEEGKVNEAYQQIAFADKIILNKLDLVPASSAMRCQDRIHSINKFAKILPAVRGRVKLSELSDMRAHDMSNFWKADPMPEVPSELSGQLRPTSPWVNIVKDEQQGAKQGPRGPARPWIRAPEDFEGRSEEAGGAQDAEKEANRHDSRVNSMSCMRSGEILPERLGAWMQVLGTLPRDAPERGTIFRIKGIFNIKDHPYKHVFHAVMDVSDEDDVGEWAEGEKRMSKIVFIGKSLDEQFFRDGFNSIFE